MNEPITKETILALVREYIDGRAQTPFTPGTSRVHYAGRVFDADEVCSLVDAALDFWLTLGPYGRELERELTAFQECADTVLVSSGSAANLMAMAALCDASVDGHLVPGDEVVTPAVTFPTSLNPILQHGLMPVVVDCDVATLNIKPELLAEAIGPRTRALFLPHTLGMPFDLDTVVALCREHHLWLIEDSCDALGSCWNGRRVGTFGALGTLSCYPAHHITMGEGGAVFVNDARLTRVVRSLRDWGRDCWCTGDSGPRGACGNRLDYHIDGLDVPYDHRYVYSHIGYNLKPTDLQAAVGAAQMKKLPGFIAARKRNAGILRDGLAAYADRLLLPRVPPQADPSWFCLPITVREGAGFTRRELTGFLEERGIETRLIFAGNILRQPAYRDIPARRVGDMSGADAVMARTFFIGVYPGLTDAHLTYVLEMFGEFMRGVPGL